MSKDAFMYKNRNHKQTKANKRVSRQTNELEVH